MAGYGAINAAAFGTNSSTLDLLDRLTGKCSEDPIPETLGVQVVAGVAAGSTSGFVRG
jgi:hypothetical protein